MKKFLSIFVALAMVLSLFAGVGARTAKAAAGTITTASTIAIDDEDPTVVVTLAGDTFTPTGTSTLLASWTIDVGATGLTASTITRTDDTHATIAFTGTAAAGTVYIRALAAALTGALASNSIDVVVPATLVPVTSIIVTGAGGATTVGVGGTLAMSAAVSPANATDKTVTWTESTATVKATINATTGVLTGVATGPTTVTATSVSTGTVTGTEVITVVTAVTATATGVAATNGTVTVTLSGTPTVAPVLGNFAATTTINGGTTTALTSLAGFHYNGTTTVTFTFTPIIATTAAQSVIVGVKYLGGTEIFAPAFIVPVAVSAATQLTISTPTLTLSKVADGTTTAAVTKGVLAGVVSPDVVTVSAVATYDTALVGTGKTITVVYTLGGADAAKYVKPVNYTVATGEITAAAGVGIPVLTLTQPLTTTNVNLAWTYSGAVVTGFSIYRNQTGNSTDLVALFAPIYTAAASTTGGTYIDTTTIANQVYYYWVGAVTATGTTLSVPKAISTTVATAVVPVIPGAASTLTVTPSGNFAGGVDGTSTASTNAVGTVGTDSSVTVTTAGVGAYYGTMSVSTVVPNIYSTDVNWDLTGYQWVNVMTTATALTAFPIGSKIAVAGTSTNGVGTVIAIGTTATPASSTSVALATNPFGAGVAYNNIPLYVNISTAVVGVIGTKVYTVATVKPAFSTNWLTLGNYATMGFTVYPGQLITVNMDPTDEGQYATAFLIVSGIPVKGDVATVTWQDTLAASHTVSYTTITNDTAAKVAAALTSLINNLDATTGNVSAELASATVIQLTQDVAGVAGNGKTLTATTTAAVTPTLTIHTLGGLTSPAYVELGKTIQLVAVDATGATVTAPFALTSGTSATVSATGLVTAASVSSNLTGVSVITATSGTATGVFAVIVVPVQIITSLKINLVPALPVSITKQQFGAIASNAAYSALDYTTQAVWTDALPVASIKATTGLLTYSTDETGNVYASAGGITATANIKIATGVVTLVPVVGPVTKVIVLTIGSDIVTVDDKATTVDAAPEIVDGRTFVPIRFIAETFGSTVTWLPETKGVTIVLGDTTIGLQIGNATAVINGTIIALDAAPYIKNSRTMVPLRVISESFGGNVAWDPINHIITITYVLPVVLPAA